MIIKLAAKDTTKKMHPALKGALTGAKIGGTIGASSAATLGLGSAAIIAALGVKMNTPMFLKGMTKITGSGLLAGGLIGAGIGANVGAVKRLKAIYSKEKTNINKVANFKQLIRPLQRNKKTTIALAAYGGLTGATMGNLSNVRVNKAGVAIKDKDGKLSRRHDTNTLSRTLLGAGTGVVAGLGLARGLTGNLDSMTKNSRNFQRTTKNFGRRWSRFGEGFGRTSKPSPKASATEVSSFFKTHAGVDHTTIKTKKEATKAFYAASRKHHPDMGGSKEKFQDVTASWDKIKNTEWFEKLAMVMNKLRRK